MTTARDTSGGRAAPRASVAEEMEAVFAPLPHAAHSAPHAPSIQQNAVRHGISWRWAASFVAAALIAAGVLIFMARPIPVAPLQPLQRRAPTAPMIPTATVRAASAVRITAQPMAPPSIAAPPTATRVERPRPSPIALKHPERCPASATEAWCRRAEVAAADDHLRDAYDEAIRAGLDRDTLVAVRNDWARLRGRANRDPEALIRGYGVLTRQLYDELERQGR